MTFLSPVWLLLGAAAAVPLLMHLLQRHLGARLEFPAARYLARAEREHSRSLRIRNLLLMVLRIALVAAIAAAAARPVAGVGRGHGATAVALVLDNSMSTGLVVGGRSVVVRLKTAAASIAAFATASDRLWLVTANGAVVGGTPATIRSAIDHLTPLGGAGDVTAAAARAAALVASAGLAMRSVAIATDGQATAWQWPVWLGEVRATVYVPRLPVPPNRAVLTAVPRPPRWTPHGAVEAALATSDSVPYRLVLAGRTAVRGTAAPGEPITLRLSPDERGWVDGRIELAPDELRGDDTRWFAVWIGSPPLVVPTPLAGAFVHSAIGALRDGGAVVSGGTAGAAVSIGGADEIRALPALIFAPRDPLQVGTANRALERLGIDWRFGALRRGEAQVHGARLEGVTASLRYALVRSAGTPTDTLAVAGGAPWIVAGDRFVLIGSPPDPSATSLPLRAVFVPWMGDVIVERLVGERGGVVESPPGARLSVPLWAAALDTLAGPAIPLTGTFTAPARPGVYFFTRTGKRVGALVVNPEPQESRLERLGDDRWHDQLRTRDVRVTGDARSWREAIFDRPGGRPFGTPLLLTALALLAVEGAVAAARPPGRV
ncbi:MAG: BatA domain-containing protein [Gemmatimonadaceae bacterium]